MKKVLALVLITIMMLSGCSSAITSADLEAAEKSGYQEGYATGYADAQADLAAAAPTQAPTAAPTLAPTPTPQPTVNDIGSRKNPAKINQTLNLVLDTYHGKGNISITLVEVIRGEEAWSLIYSANKFNDPPSDAQEYIMAKFTVTFDKDTSGVDEALKLDKHDFNYVTGDFSVKDNISIVHPDPEFDITLYEGATDEGWVCLLVDKNDSNPMAVFMDNIWFSLS